MKSPIVSSFSRAGVIQAKRFAPSHARTPLAPPTAAAAVAMHWAHMPHRLGHAALSATL